MLRDAIRSGLAGVMILLASVAGGAEPAARSKSPGGCGGLPSHSQLHTTLQSVVRQGSDANGGMGNQMWAAVVDRDGIVCAVVYSGTERGSQWPGSRLIAAQKASTANALSIPTFALSSGNLFYPSQPGQSLYSLTTSAPPNPEAAYAGPAERYGQPNDPLVGKPLGGVIVFGGGLALYDAKGKLLGALGVSGDTSCTDHIVAWKVRHALKLDAVPAGVAPGRNDNLILDLKDGGSASGFGHPTCRGGKSPDDIIRKLPKDFSPGPKR